MQEFECEIINQQIVHKKYYFNYLNDIGSYLTPVDGGKPNILMEDHERVGVIDLNDTMTFLANHTTD